MTNLFKSIREALLRHGADLVSFGDLREIPSENRFHLPMGICVAVKYPKAIIRGITQLPTQEYYEYYTILNKKLDSLVTLGAEALQKADYRAVAQTLSFVEYFESDYTSMLPHKTVATRSGLGWIGKSALLVTEQFGSMIRISSILTDAPLETATPVNISKCGSCLLCAKACPGGAILGKNWSVNTYRDAFYNASQCRKAARQRAVQGFGKEVTLCGKCIAVCPYTKRYLNGGSYE